MTEYLQVQCPRCKLSWNYYDERTEFDGKLTSKNIQGIVCPNCGAYGIITTQTSEKDVWAEKTNSNQL